jgi:HAD superfamily hydrolase (TIGR01484 family)
MPDDSPTAILCFDFDGTLVDRPSDPYDIAQLEQLLGHMQERGAVWGINTGRSLHHTLDGLRDHGFRSAPDFIIARESEIYHRNETNRWVDLGDWNQRCAADHKRFYKAHAKFFKILKHHLADAFHGVTFLSDNVEPAGIVAQDDAQMSEVCQWIDSHAKDWPDLAYQRNSIWLRFTHRGYDKGSALMEVRNILEIGPEFTFAAGDNYNDLSMLNSKIAHGLACPGNSVPEVVAQVQAHGGYLATQEATAGMIAAIEHYFYRD